MHFAWTNEMSHLNRKVEHDVSEVLLGEEMIIQFIFLGSVQLREWICAAKALGMRKY